MTGKLSYFQSIWTFDAMEVTGIIQTVFHPMPSYTLKVNGQARTINVPADAWADVPVRVSVRAADTSGAQATGFVNVTPTGDQSPVSPSLGAKPKRGSHCD